MNENHDNLWEQLDNYYDQSTSEKVNEETDSPKLPKTKQEMDSPYFNIFHF